MINMTSSQSKKKTLIENDIENPWNDSNENRVRGKTIEDIKDKV